MSRNGYGIKTTRYVGISTYDNYGLCPFLVASGAFGSGGVFMAKA